MIGCVLWCIDLYLKETNTRMCALSTFQIMGIKSTKLL
jgi:hypothetical protein